MSRPFLRLSSSELLGIGITAARVSDLETASYCWLGLSPKHRKRGTDALTALEYFLDLYGVTPIPWLEDAAEVTHHFASNSAGHHNVYVVLLAGVEKERYGYKLYVGMTGLSPEERFANHKARYKAAKVVTKYGRCLLPSLYKHLNPMSFEEAKRLESKVAEALDEAEIPVHPVRQ